MSQATEAFWLLSDPFEPRPDIRFLVPSRPIRTALAALQQTLQAEESKWTLLVGPPGVGKGVLVQLFAEAWTDPRPLVLIPDASVPYGDLCAQIQEQLDPSTAASSPIIFLEGAEDLSSNVITALGRDGEEMAPSARFVVVLDQCAESPAPGWAKEHQARLIPLEPMDAAETQHYVQRRVRLAAGGGTRVLQGCPL
ncbi:AAA family ATPase [Myxococcota bacterium]|nr:AAA family ATPase [Myxococcota bacterium]